MWEKLQKKTLIEKKSEKRKKWKIKMKKKKDKKTKSLPKPAETNNHTNKKIKNECKNFF